MIGVQGSVGEVLACNIMLAALLGLLLTCLYCFDKYDWGRYFGGRGKGGG